MKIKNGQYMQQLIKNAKLWQSMDHQVFEAKRICIQGVRNCYIYSLGTGKT